MQRIVPTASLLIVLLFAGCKKAELAKGASLKSFIRQDDALVVQTFLDGATLTQQTQKSTVEGGITNQWFPSDITFQPVVASIVSEGGRKEKGAVVTVHDEYYRISGYGQPEEGKHGEGVCILDENELKDLSNALAYFLKTASDWDQHKPTHYEQAHFTSKDGLLAKMYTAKDKTAFAIEAENIDAFLTNADVVKLKATVDKATVDLQNN